MRYRYAFASSGWGAMDDSYGEPVGVLKGAKPTWEDTAEQSYTAAHNVVSRHNSMPLVQCYLKHPVLTLLFNGIALLSLVAIVAHIFVGIHTLHPLVLLFIALASGSLSLVLVTAVEEFYAKKEKE